MTSPSSSGIETFLDECRDLLSQVEECALALEADPRDQDGVNRLFRIFHTVKGSSAMVGLAEVAAFTHHVEALLEHLRSGQLEISTELVSVVLASKDHIEALVAASVEAQPLPPGQAAELAARLAALSPASARAPAAPATAPASLKQRWNIRLSPRPGAFISESALGALMHDLGRVGEVGLRLDEADVPPIDVLDPLNCYFFYELALVSDISEDRLRDLLVFVETDAEAMITSEPFFGDLSGPVVLFDELPQSLPVARPGPVAAPATKKAGRLAESMVRVSSTKLDSLVSLVGELVITQARLSQLTAHTTDPALAGSVEALERLVVELRDGVLGVQMMPIGSTFGRFNRLVHDLAASLGKKVDLVTEGAETELDKSVLDHLVDPLLHLVRNAVDHGIESEELRLARGKSARGTVRLGAQHEGQFVVITIQDDGNGLDADAIRAKGIERGVISAEQSLSPSELYKLIFLPGFSTAKQVSDVSGRGVGLDVVKRQLDALRGVVTITSEPGLGATLSLRLPLTLAIIDGLLVEVDASRYILPLASVTEAVELPPGDRDRYNGRRAVDVRGALVPYVSLRDTFGASGAPPAAERVVLLEDAGQRVGLVVDRVLGQRQTVIQSLGHMYRSIDVVSGATILGDGEVALILDIGGVVRQAQAGRAEQ